MKFLYIILFLVLPASIYAQSQGTTVTTSFGGVTSTATVVGISINTTTRAFTVTIRRDWVDTHFLFSPQAWLSTSNNILNQASWFPLIPTGTTQTRSGFTYPVGGTVRLYLGTFVKEDSGDNAIRASNTVYFDVGASGATAPTPTLSPSGGAGAILTGQTFSGTASGAMAGNAYNISIVSGDGSASINPSTGAYTVTAGSTGGIVHYKVWVSAGNGFDRSPDAEANIAVSLSKKVKVTIPANNGKFAIEYKLYQGGVEIGSVIRLPGEGAIITTIDVGDNDGPVTMKSFTSGIMTDDVVFVEDVAGVVEQDVPVVITPNADPETPPTVVPPPQTSSTLAQTAAGSQPALVWSSEGAPASDALTNGVFREGVGKIVNAMTGGDMEPIPDQTAAINATESDSTAKVNTMLSGIESVEDATGNVRADVESRKPVLVAVEGSQWIYTLPMPMLTENITIDLSWAETPINLMRTVIKVCFLLFMWFLYGRTLRSASV